MKTQNTPITDSTVIKTSPEVKKSAKSSLWQSVLIGGVPGILIGAAGTIGVEAIADSVHEKPDVSAGISQEEAPVETTTEILEAHSVTDDMSFSEAFAAARDEVGPGGAFVWHGQVYGTYRGDDPEWQEMSAEDRAEHSQAIIAQVHPAPYTTVENEPEIVPVQEEDQAPEAAPEDTAESPDDGVDVHIVDIVQEQLGNGTIITTGVGHVDGHYAEFVDTDGDGEVDTVLIDANDNQTLDDGERLPMPNSGLTVDVMLEEVQANAATAVDNALYGNMPDYTNDTSDYTNDADASSFC